MFGCLTMRMICSSRFYGPSVLGTPPVDPHACTHLESLVLEHPLDGGILARGMQLRLKDDTERPISDDLALRVLHLSGLARHAVLHLFANDLCQKASSAGSRCEGGGVRRGERTSHPQAREGSRPVRRHLDEPKRDTLLRGVGWEAEAAVEQTGIEVVMEEVAEGQQLSGLRVSALLLRTLLCGLG